MLISAMFYKLIILIITLVSFESAAFCAGRGLQTEKLHSNNEFNPHSARINKLMNRIHEAEGYCVFSDEIVMIPEDDHSESPSKHSESIEPSNTVVSNQHLAKISSAFASTLFSSLVTYPLDVIKKRSQFNTSQQGQWFKGSGAHAAAMCFSVGIGMSTYEVLKGEQWSPFAAGVVGTLLANTTTTPLWVFQVRTAMAPEKQPYKISHFLRDIKAQPKTAFRGQYANLLSLGPQAGYYHLYEEFNDLLKRSMNPSEPPSGNSSESSDGMLNEMGQHALAAGSARILVLIPSYPIDTLRLHRQQYGTSYSEIAQKMLTEGGVARFYRGFFWATLRGAAGTAVYMGFYQKLKKNIESFEVN